MRIRHAPNPFAFDLICLSFPGGVWASLKPMNPAYSKLTKRAVKRWLEGGCSSIWPGWRLGDKRLGGTWAGGPAQAGSDQRSAWVCLRGERGQPGSSGQVSAVQGLSEVRDTFWNHRKARGGSLASTCLMHKHKPLGFFLAITNLQKAILMEQHYY